MREGDRVEGGPAPVDAATPEVAASGSPAVPPPRGQGAATTPDEVETFWPPPPDEFVAWRRRLGVLLMVVLAPVFVLLVGLGSLELVDRFRQGQPVSGGDLIGRVLLSAGLVTAGAVLAFVILPRFTSWSTARGLSRMVTAARQALQPGERLVVLSLCAFLDKRYQIGFLAITDRRLLRLHGTWSGFQCAELLAREDLVDVARTVRRATRNAVVGLVLRSMRTEEGLALRGRGGERFFLTVESMILGPLAAWFERAGHELSFQNDADLDERLVPTPVSFRNEVLPGQRRQTLLWTACFALCFVAVPAVVVGVLTAYRDRQAAPFGPRVPASAAFGPGWSPFPAPPGVPAIGISAVGTATIPLARVRRMTWSPEAGAVVEANGSAMPPSGPERLLAVFDLSTFDPGAQITVWRRFELVRIGEQGILRSGSPPSAADAQRNLDSTYLLGWEPLGQPGDPDEGLIDLARKRLQVAAAAVTLRSATGPR